MSSAEHIHTFLHMRQSRVRPDAFRQASAVRNIGIGLTGLVSILSGAMLLALWMIISLAVELLGSAGPFLPGLAASLVLGGYLAAAPPMFARRTRASTAEIAGGWLLAALAGYGVLWAVLLATL
jgi:hypothetical protein